MENLFKGSIPFITLIITGLSAGFFYAWAVSVIPGTKRISDPAYIETMQHINRAIINPWFMVIFFGPILAMIITAVLQYNLPNSAVFFTTIAALMVYIAGTFGVTAFGNVPLNDGLDTVNMANLSTEQLSNIRSTYELQWNRLHTIRTAASVISFTLLAKALLLSKVL